VFRKKRSSIEREIKRKVSQWIYLQPEIRSLLQEGVPGSLNATLGFEPSQAGGAVDSIVRSIVDSTEVKVTQINKNLKGGIQINCQPSSFANLLNSTYSVINTEKGVSLNWLDWLLTQGDKIIVVGYEYKAGSVGRSGAGYMQSSSVGFRIDPQFSGTADDNFITRAFSGKEEEIKSIVQRIINA